jgi:trypsin-like peptidase/FHA domain-containing protein
MKIIIRYQGMLLSKKDLRPGEYTIGRSTENDIPLSHKFISRRHARIYYKDNEWWYQDLREEHPNFKKDPIKITKDTKIDIENQVELFVEDFLNFEQTQVHFVSDYKDATDDEKTFNYRKIAVFSIIGLLFLTIAGGSIYYFINKSNRPMDANELFTKVRPKIVEFLKTKDPKAIQDFKKYANVKDEEFREEIGFCTGFMVEPGIVLTANHCFHGLTLLDSIVGFNLKTSDGKIHEAKRILGFDIKKDYLFLEVPSLKAYGNLEINPKECKVGEKVYTIGNVSGEGVAIREGIMASKTKDRNHPEIEFVRYSAAASPGNSGGPLIDESGKVVALVFAATRAENYNLGTGSKSLLEGKNWFVDDLNPKKVKIETKNILNYRPDQLVFLLNLPISGTWFENPDYIRPFENIVAEVDVPSDISIHYDRLISKFSKAFCDTFEEVRTKIKDDGLTVQDWESQTTEETPIIIPYQNNFNKLYSKSKEGDRLIIQEIALLIPMDLYSYKVFKKKLKNENKYEYRTNTQIMRLNNDLKPDADRYSFVYRSGRSDSKDVLNRFSGIPICQYLGRHEVNDGGWDDVRKASDKTIMEVLVGNGLLYSSRDSFYLRPNARRSFLIKNFEETVAESEFKDILGRSWKVFSFQLFGNITIDNYCIQMPQGVFCLSESYNATSESLLRVLRENYYKYRLSSMLISPIHWSMDALHDYYAKGLISNLPLMKDIGFKKLDDGGITITLKTLGIEFSIPESKVPDTIRFASGMYYNQGNKKWIGLGFEGIYSEKNKFQICGVGVELKDSNTSSVLRRIREEEISKKKLMNMMGKENIKESDKTSKIWREEIKSKTIDTDITLFGYCAPFEKHEESETDLSIKFSSRKPLKVDYRLLGDN